MGNPHTDRSRRHNEAKLDRIELTVPKGEKALITAAAAAAGMSVNAFFKQALQEKMDRMKEQE